MMWTWTRVKINSSNNSNSVSSQGTGGGDENDPNKKFTSPKKAHYEECADVNGFNSDKPKSETRKMFDHIQSEMNSNTNRTPFYEQNQNGLKLDEDVRRAENLLDNQDNDDLPENPTDSEVVQTGLQVGLQNEGFIRQTFFNATTNGIGSVVENLTNLELNCKENDVKFKATAAELDEEHIKNKTDLNNQIKETDKALNKFNLHKVSEWFLSLNWFQKILFCMSVFIGAFGFLYFLGNLIYRWWSGGTSLWSYFSPGNVINRVDTVQQSQQPVLLRVINTSREIRPSWLSSMFSLQPQATINEHSVEYIYRDSNGNIIERVLETPNTNIVSTLNAPLQLPNNTNIDSGVDIKDSVDEVLKDIKK